MSISYPSEAIKAIVNGKKIICLAIPFFDIEKDNYSFEISKKK